MDKDAIRLRKRTLKSLRTHLAKRVIFSLGFKGVKILDTIEHKKRDDVISIILSISHNSKIDINDANNLITHVKNVRTYDDLELKTELSIYGVDIIYDQENNNRFRLHFFKGVSFASEKIVGYKTNDGFAYAWIELIDYNANPDVILDEYTITYHKVLQSLVSKNIRVSDAIDWTTLIETQLNSSTTNQIQRQMEITNG